MNKLKSGISVFKNFLLSIYATDATFQQCFGLSRSIQEGTLFFSKKHKLHGLKAEVSVLPNVLLTFCISHNTQDKSDVLIVPEMVKGLKISVQKMYGEFREEAFEIGSSWFPGLHSMFFHKVFRKKMCF